MQRGRGTCQSLTFGAVEAVGVAALVRLGVLLPLGVAGLSALSSVAALGALRGKPQLVNLSFAERSSIGVLQTCLVFMLVCNTVRLTDLRGEAVR